MRTALVGLVVVAGFLGLATASFADSRTEKFNSNGCEVERKFERSGKSESKVECKPRFQGARMGGSGKEEFRRGGCEVKREWKENGEFKEEVKCR